MYEQEMLIKFGEISNGVNEIKGDIGRIEKKVDKQGEKINEIDARLIRIEEWKKELDVKNFTPRTKIIITFGSIGGGLSIGAAIVMIIKTIFGM